MKKAYFWSKYGTENSNSTLDTSAESIKSSLAAHSAEAVCSYSIASQSTDTDSSLAENSDGLSVPEDASKLAEHSPTKDGIPKDWKSGIPAIRVTSIAHKDSISISKTKHTYSSSTLNSKDPCRKRCIKTKSKSVVGLDSEHDSQLSWSVAKNLPSDARDDPGRSPEDKATDLVGLHRDLSKDNEGKLPCNELRVVLTSEDNLSTDLLADECTDERNYLGDDTSETANEGDNGKRVLGKPESLDDARFQRMQEQSGDERVSEEVLETSSDWLCSKCGCNLPPFDVDKSLACDEGEAFGDYGRLSPLLCLECASSKLESEMAQLDEWCRVSGNDSDQNAGSSSEESTENCKEALGSDGGSNGCEDKGYQFQLVNSLYTLKEDQLEELAKHLMRSQKILLNSGEGHAMAAGTVELDAMDLPIVVPSAGSVGSCLFNVQQLNQKVEDNGVSTHSSLEADSRKSPEETEGSVNGVVDSLRNTVAHFLSKLTHKHSMELGRCSPGNPRQGTTDGACGESSKAPSHSKDVRYRFVYSLARAYSNRSKQLEVGRDGNQEKLKVEKDRGEQLTVLLRGKELGSQIIGERMAQATPHTLDRTLSLVLHKNGKRKARAAKSDSSKSPAIDTKEASGDKENTDQPVKRSDSNLQVENMPDVTAGVHRTVGSASVMDNHDGKGLEEEEKKHAFESYYEKQLSLDLEEGSSAEPGTAPS